TREALPMDTFHIKPRPMELVVGEPIPTTGLTPRDMDALAARVQKAVEDLYYARAGVADPRKSAAETPANQIPAPAAGGD
ncbi:MAG: hypothetical protein ACRD24_15780, partial [Terriglobales bacterium]